MFGYAVSSLCCTWAFFGCSVVFLIVAASLLGKMWALDAQASVFVTQGL